MPRSGKRVRIARGIYRDGDDGGYEVRVVVGGHEHSERMPPDSTRQELDAKWAELKATGLTDTPRPERGTLNAAVPIYLRMVAHLASADDLEDHCRAWTDRLGHLQRHRITSQHVLDARNVWRKAGKSPKTINNRVGTLRNLYRRLDGPKAKTPCDDV